MTIKVLHLIGGGEIGGAEEHVLNLIQNYDNRRVKGYLGCLINNSPFAELAHSIGIPTKIFPMKLPIDICPVLQIVRYCRTNNITIVHCHGARANLVGRLAAKLIKIPAVSTLHSHPESDYSAGWKGKIALFLDYMTLPLASGIITVSNDLKSFISRRLTPKGKSLPIRTIYNGVRELDFSSKDSLRYEFREKFCIPDNFIVIGTIGRLHPVKGQSSLIEAAIELAKEFPNIHLLIVGEGPLHPYLETKLGASQLSFTLTGYLPSAWRILPAMDIFVLPSLNEGMGLVLLEAAQAGVPIVASNVGGIPELLCHGEDSLLIRPGFPLDITFACSKLLNDRSLNESLVANAYRRVKLFTPEKMASNTTDFYINVLNKLSE